MKAYKLEVFIIDFDNLGEDEIKSEIENTRFSNDCITPEVKNIIGVDIGDWSENHPLNKYQTAHAYYLELFKTFNKQK